MKRTSLALLVLAACVSHVPLKDSPLASRMRDEISRDAPQAEPLNLSSRQFLFIAGFLNGAIPGYFNDNIDVVQTEYKAEADAIYPSSLNGMGEDVELIRTAVLERYAKTKKPVVLFGHSKGGAAAVLTVIKYPELMIDGKVDRVIAVQGAFGGSPVADGLTSTAPLAVLPHFKGLESLKTHDCSSAFADERAKLGKKLTTAQVEWMSERIFYVRSHERVSHVCPELLITYNYLSKFGSGQNDGLLLEEDMKLDGLGIDLGVLDSDHASLTVSGPLSNSTASERKAFTRALVTEVFERPDASPP